MRLWIAVPFAAVILSQACVTSGTYEICTNDLAKTKKDLASAQDAAAQDHNSLVGKNNDLDTKLTASMGENSKLASKLTSMGQNVDQLLGEKDAMAKERAQLTGELEELRRLREQGDARNAEYKKLLTKLHEMIDAGTLQVKIRGGRMIVQMSSDLLFPPGGTKLKPDAVAAVTDLAESLKGFPDRKFQIVGHSDSTPIHTGRYPSNWELSSERAIEVMKVMIDAGVPATMLSAAGSAEFDPLEANDTDDHKKANRRVELVFMPKIDELPGFADVLKGAGS